MSDRFAFFYQPLESFEFTLLLDVWLSRGLSLKNPATGRMTSITGEGDQVDTSVESLQAALLSRIETTFQLWITDSTDLYCRIRFLPDSKRLVEEYSLVGLGSSLDFVLNVLLDRFKSQASRADNLFFVADREGYTIEEDWDRLSVSGTYQGSCPNVLGLSANRFSDFKQCVDGATELLRYDE